MSSLLTDARIDFRIYNQKRHCFTPWVSHLRSSIAHTSLFFLGTIKEYWVNLGLMQFIGVEFYETYLDQMLDWLTNCSVLGWVLWLKRASESDSWYSLPQHNPWILFLVSSDPNWTFATLWWTGEGILLSWWDGRLMRHHIHWDLFPSLGKLLNVKGYGLWDCWGSASQPGLLLYSSDLSPALYSWLEGF